MTSNVEAIPRLAVAAPAALVATPAAHHMQIGSSDVQSLQHVHSSLPARPNYGMCLFALICHPAAGPIVHQDRLFQACFPVFSTVCLELAATNSPDQQLPVCFKSRLKTFLFTHAKVTTI